MENAADPITAGYHQPCLASSPMPPTRSPRAASTQAALAAKRAASSPSSLENAQDPSGQRMPGLSSKTRQLCPKYSRWTKPCSAMNAPMMNLNIEPLPVEKAWSKDWRREPEDLVVSHSKSGG